MSVFVLLLLVATAAVKVQAQEDVVITLPTMMTEINQEVSVDVTVKNWTQIVSAQWSTHWDANVLSFVSVTNFAIPGSVEANFGIPPVTDDNTLTFSWFDESLQGISLDDDTVLFTIIFNVVGSEGAVSEVSLDGFPTAIELTTVNMQFLDVEFNDGQVTVDGDVFIETVHTKDFALHTNMPNPFTTYTNIILDLNKQSKVMLTIYTVDGRELYNKEYNLSAGSHQLPVSANIFPTKGVYLYKISTDEVQATRKMTFVD